MAHIANGMASTLSRVEIARGCSSRCSSIWCELPARRYKDSDNIEAYSYSVEAKVKIVETAAVTIFCHFPYRVNVPQTVPFLQECSIHVAFGHTGLPRTPLPMTAMQGIIHLGCQPHWITRPSSRKILESASGGKDWGYEGVILHLYWRPDLTDCADSHKNLDKMCSNDQRVHLVHVILAAKK
jgi:hypothetical protein